MGIINHPSSVARTSAVGLYTGSLFSLESSRCPKIKSLHHKWADYLRHAKRILWSGVVKGLQELPTDLH